MSLAQEIDTPSGSLFAFGCFDPGAVDAESDAIVAWIVVVTTNSTVVASITGAKNLLGLVFGVVVVVFGTRGILPVGFRVVFWHCV